MNRAATFALVALPFFGAALFAESQPSKAAPASPQAESAMVKAGFLTAPLQFEENRGQAPEGFDFISRGRGSMVFLRSNQARITVAGKKGCAASVTLALKKASGKVKGEAVEKLPRVVNYFHGSDSTKWIKNVSTTSRVKYEGVYPGVDVVYYGTRQVMEYDFVVAPHADPSRICWEATGADSVKVDSQGNLVMTCNGLPMQVNKPVAYQIQDGKKKNVDARFSVSGKEVRFALNSYDKKQALVIDPVVQIVYSTFLGGNYADQANAVAIDNAGDIFVTGWTESYNFPVTTGSAHANTNYYNEDVFVTMLARLTLSGTTIISGTSTPIAANTSALSLSGTNVTVTGSNLFISGTSFGTGSVALTGSGFLVSGSGVTISGSTGVTVATATQYNLDSGFSTYIGGDSEDAGTAIGVQASGPMLPFSSPAIAVYVTGNTSSPHFPIQYQTGHEPLLGQQAPSVPGEMNAFAVKLDTGVMDSGTGQIVYSNLIGAVGGQTSGRGISVAPDGEVNIAGQTTSGYFNAWPFVSSSSGFIFGLTLYTTNPTTGVETANTDSTPPLAFGSDQAMALEIQNALNNLSDFIKQSTQQAAGTFVCGTTATPHQLTLSYQVPVGPVSSTGTTANPLAPTLPVPTVPQLSGTYSGSSWFVSPVLPTIESGSTSLVSSTTSSQNGSNYFTTVSGTQTVTYNVDLTFVTNEAVAYVAWLDSYGVMVPENSTIFGQGIDDSANAIACDWSHNVTVIGGQTYEVLSNGLTEGVPYVLSMGNGGWGTVLQPVGKTSPQGDWGAVNAVALDQADNIYAAGYTESTVFATYAPFQTYPQTLDSTPPSDGSGSGVNGFIAKFDPTGSVPIFATYFGGSMYDTINGLAVDTFGNIYVTGQTASITGANNGDFPTLGTAAGQTMDHNSGAAFLSVLVPQGNALRYSSVFGGTQIDEGMGVAVTSGTNLNPTACVVGYTNSPDFPTTLGSFMPAYPSESRGSSGFVTTFQDQSVNLWLESITTDVQVPIPNQPMTYTVTVKNISSVDACNAVVYQTLSASEVFVSAQGPNITNYSPGSLSGSTDTVVATLGTVLAGGEVSYQITVTPTGPQVIQTTATVESENDGLVNSLYPSSLTLEQVAMPVVSLAVTQAQASEDGTPGFFTVSRVGDLSEALNILYTVSGSNTLNGVDYAYLSGTAVMPAGASSVDVDVNPYPVVDGTSPKSVSIQVIQGTGYVLGTALSGTVSIAEVPLNVVSVAATSGTASKDGQSATLTLTRTGIVGNALPVTLQVWGSGTAQVAATAGFDYSISGVDSTALAQSGSFIVTFPANTNTATIIVTPIPDSISGHPNQTTGFNVSVVEVPKSLQSGSASTPGSAYVLSSSSTAAVTILDPSYTGPTVTVTTLDPLASLTGTSGLFEITRTGGDTTVPLSVSYTMGGSANPGVDYQSLPGTVTIPANDLAITVPVVPIANSLATVSSTATMTLDPGTGYIIGPPSSASVTVSNSGTTSQAVVNLSAISNTATQTAGTLVFAVTRTGDISQAILVNYSTSGNAVAGVDYETLTGSIALPPNVATENIVIQPLWDPNADGTQVVYLQLAGGSGYSLGSNTAASGAIYEVPQTVVSASAAIPVATETGTNGVFTLTRSGTNLAEPLLVSISMGGSAVNGVDYALIPSVVTIPAGSNSANVYINPTGTVVASASASVILTVEPSSNYTTGAATAGYNINPAATSAIVYIPKFTGPAVNVTAIRNVATTGSTGIFRFVRTGSTSAKLTVKYNLAGTATNGTSYNKLSGSVTIPAGSVSANVVVTPARIANSTTAQTVILSTVASPAYKIGTGQSALVTIAAPPVVTVTLTADPTASSVYEGYGPVRIIFSRSGGSNALPLKIPYILGGTAKGGTNYVVPKGFITIPANASQAVLSIQTKDDHVVDPTLTLIVVGAASSSYTLAAPGEATVSILDDDLQ